MEQRARSMAQRTEGMAQRRARSMALRIEGMAQRAWCKGHGAWRRGQKEVVN